MKSTDQRTDDYITFLMNRSIDCKGHQSRLATEMFVSSIANSSHKKHKLSFLYFNRALNELKVFRLSMTN